MFGIGPMEMLVVAVLALLLFSPRELPKIIKGITQLWGSLRRTADEFRDAIMQEEALQDLKDAVDGTKAQLRDAESAARRELMKARMEARRAENKLVRVARERERQEREAEAKQTAESGEGGEGEASGPAPAGTVAAGATAATPGAGATGAAATGSVATESAAPKSQPVPPTRPAAASEPPPKTVDPRHAGKSGGSGGDSSANQGAA